MSPRPGRGGPPMRSRQLLTTAVAFASLFGSAGVGTAAQHCVNPGGTGGCFAAIQAAVNAAADRDEILIAAGTYAEPFVVISGKRLSLVGAGAEATVIQSGIRFQDFSRPESSISGVRIDHSDGVEIVSAKVTINDCVITGA